MSQESVLPASLRSILFESLMEFMIRCEVSETAMRESFEEALANVLRSRGATKIRRRDGSYINTQNLPAQLLRIWYRDSRYIDHEAKPRALSWGRGRDSLLSLMKGVDPAADADAVLRGMKKAGLVRRTTSGRYLPTSEAAIFGRLDPILAEHVTRLVSRLISTVGRNVDPTKRSLSLIDRHAYTTDLNHMERKAFADFTRSHGMACLESIDDWLEQRRVSRVTTPTNRRSDKKGVAAGVYLFAYLGDDEGVKLLRSPSSKADTRRAGSRTPPKSSRVSKSRSAREARA